MRTVGLSTTHCHSTHDNALLPVVSDIDTLDNSYPHNKLEQPFTCYIYVINTVAENIRLTYRVHAGSEKIANYNDSE